MVVVWVEAIVVSSGSKCFLRAVCGRVLSVVVSCSVCSVLAATLSAVCLVIMGDSLELTYLFLFLATGLLLVACC